MHRSLPTTHPPTLICGGSAPAICSTGAGPTPSVGLLWRSLAERQPQQCHLQMLATHPQLGPSLPFMADGPSSVLWYHHLSPPIAPGACKAGTQLSMQQCNRLPTSGNIWALRCLAGERKKSITSMAGPVFRRCPCCVMRNTSAQVALLSKTSQIPAAAWQMQHESYSSMYSTLRAAALRWPCKLASCGRLAEHRRDVALNRHRAPQLSTAGLARPPLKEKS
jgi:hypothetical protein